jgi:hypothetical protein
VFISPHCPEDPCDPIVTKISKSGDLDSVLISAKFGVDLMRGVGSAESRKLTLTL